LDDEGRQILLPVLRPVSEQNAEQRREAKGTADLEILKSLAEEPALSVRERAFKFGMPESSLRLKLSGLVKRKFVEQAADKRYRLTAKGRKEIIAAAT
jgi:hypothetical protein